jgi:hypothetical protein
MKILIILLIAVTFTFTGANNALAQRPNCEALYTLYEAFAGLCYDLEVCTDHTCALKTWYLAEWWDLCNYGTPPDIPTDTLMNRIDQEKDNMYAAADCLDNSSNPCYPNMANATWEDDYRNQMAILIRAITDCAVDPNSCPENILEFYAEINSLRDLVFSAKEDCND